MIERQIVAASVKENEIQEYIMSVLKNLGHSHIKLQRTPLGEKIIIHASRPGLIVGRKGANIKRLTEDLKAHFKLENPQIEINEVEQPNLDAQIVAERIASSLEKFGTQRFKGVGHRVMADVMDSGALGVEILITGKIPSSRAKRWRFYQGYLKKCGDVALEGVRTAYAAAQLKTGSVGIMVKIMPPETKLPDEVTINKKDALTEEIKEGAAKPAKNAGKKASEKKAPEKKASEKKASEKNVPEKKASEKNVPEKKASEKNVPEKKAPAKKESVEKEAVPKEQAAPENEAPKAPAEEPAEAPKTEVAEEKNPAPPEEEKQ